MDLLAPLQLLAVSVENHPKVFVHLHWRYSVLGPLGFWVKPFSGFSFLAATNLERAPCCSGSEGGVCGGIGFPSDRS